MPHLPPNNIPDASALKAPRPTSFPLNYIPDAPTLKAPRHLTSSLMPHRLGGGGPEALPT